MSNQVDLTNCDQEPIHIPGSIQPHGLLLALSNDLRVMQYSANAARLLGVPADQVAGSTLESLFDESAAQTFVARIRRAALELHPVYLDSIRTRDGQRRFDGIVHRNGKQTIVEFEPCGHESGNSGPDLYRLVQTSLNECRASTDSLALGACISKNIRELTGFDRVMVYRFDDEWNGQVIAEAKRDDLEPFVGLHYPASDIPKQARELYAKNWLRFISNRDYVPCPIEPLHKPGTDEMLDMSFCVLRSVSPIHLQYLRNMGVGASMSISLMREGGLWGLVACHHYAPRYVPYDVRTACEHLGQIMSLELAAQEQAELSRQARARRVEIEHIVESLRPTALPESLLDAADNLRNLLDSGGIAVIDGENIFRSGQTPSEDDIRALAEMICKDPDFQLLATDQLAEMYSGHVLSSVAAGLLAISLNRFSRRAVMWFRPELLRTVHWAGDPSKTIAKGDDGGRLSPRGSFALWKQNIQGRSKPWSASDRRTARDLQREISAKLVGHAEELLHHNRVLQVETQASQQRLDSERRARSEAERLNKLKDDFVATLSHELRTPLNAILGWSHILRSDKTFPPEHAQAITVIERNAKVQAQMVEDLLDMSRISSGKLRLDVQPVQLTPVIEASIATVQTAADAKQITIAPVLDPLSDVSVSGDPQRLQQITWNLLSNSVKFTPKKGWVRVELRQVRSHVELIITDNGAGIAPEFLPHVFDRFRQADAGTSRQHSGLGLGLAIVRQLVELHGGTIAAESEGLGKGATFTVSLPVRAVHRVETPEQHQPATPITLGLTGLSVLVVDDETDARELIRRLVEDGGAVTQLVGSAPDALAEVKRQKFDLMISDIGMPGEDGFSLIKKIREVEAREGRAKMPAIALTAYARAEDRKRILLAGFQMHVAKPVEPSELLAVVASLADRL